MEKTIGEKRVRIDFNSTNSTDVHKLKQKSAELIDLIIKIQKDKKVELDADKGFNLEVFVELNRIADLALDSVEVAAMWAVKLATYQ